MRYWHCKSMRYKTSRFLICRLCVPEMSRLLFLKCREFVPEVSTVVANMFLMCRCKAIRFGMRVSFESFSNGVALNLFKLAEPSEVRAHLIASVANLTTLRERACY